jgi:hypothetical protein
LISNGKNGKNGQDSSENLSNEASPQTLFYPNRELLDTDVVAPVPLSPNTAASMHTVVLQLFCVHEVRETLIETACGTATSLLLGLQDFVIHCNSMLQAPTAEELRGDLRLITAACRQIHSCQDGLYVLKQASESLPEDPARDYDEPADFSRLKNFGALLEDFFLSPPCTVMLEVDELARLQVQLDEVYDGACRLLELFYQAATRAASPYLLGLCCRRLYEDTRRSILPDHIDTEGDPATDTGGGDHGTASAMPPGARPPGGLLELLPRLERSLD